MKFAFACLLYGAIGIAYAVDPAEQFETKIRPVLAKNCFACHTQSRMGGLQLSSKESLLKGGNSGPAVVPGHPEQSLLIRALNYSDAKLKMPPQAKLKEEEIADLTDWIKHGVFWPEETGSKAPQSKNGEYVITPEQRAFWAFQPVRLPLIPDVKDKNWVRNPIDNFILSQLESSGLKPVRGADKRTLLRRATFDLLGLPPTPEEVEAFLNDRAPDAFSKVVDRLLNSPHYGERWGRFWLDIARYSDDKLNSTQEEPYANSFRYRDWVIQAFNKDMPYDLFVKAQIAGDFLPAEDPATYQPALGFYSLSPEMQDERVDATTRGFLGLTVACAQCHDHKFDPIPTKDFYSLQGIFAGTELHETPLAPDDVVAAYQNHKKKVEKQQAAIRKFYEAQTQQLGEILAAQTARYMLASRKLAGVEGLDQETLDRWTKYLSDPRKDHPFLKGWFDLPARTGKPEEFEKAARDFQTIVLDVLEEKKTVDDKNHIVLGIDPDRKKMSDASLFSLDRDKYVLWRNLFEKSLKDAGGLFVSGDGVLYYGEGKIERFLHGQWKAHIESMKVELAALQKALPPQYPFLQTIHDRKDPADGRIAIRGDRNNLGEIAPRRFLAILSPDGQKPFQKGSGRLELAEAIADPKNPLTARVMVNRIWQHHFGQGIVRTPSNFGQLGERPTHPELLDYLASRFVQNKWSIKAMHREIMLSATYALSADNAAANFAKDPDNRLLWRANRQRMDAETLRDSLLFVAGNLDAAPGGPAALLAETNHRRTVYGFISRRKLDGMQALFDFPNPNSTAEQRMNTNVPLQRLFFMNSPFVESQAKSFADRFEGKDDARIRQAYRVLFGRAPAQEELKLGLDFLKQATWLQYARVLLSSNEFSFIN